MDTLMTEIKEQPFSAPPKDDDTNGPLSTLRDRKEDIVVKKVPILSVGGQALKIDFDQKNTRGKSHDF
jgi:hypothetical protein